MNLNLLFRSIIITSIIVYIPFVYAQTPIPFTTQVGDTIPPNSAALWDQMNSYSDGSVASQNFEQFYDAYDCFVADDFGPMDDIWLVDLIKVRGKYFGGTGPAASVNVWIYNNDFTQVIDSALNIVPLSGVDNGCFLISLPEPAYLTDGNYWLCVQANMDYNSTGQWGWTTNGLVWSNQSQWKNPGAGYGTTCSDWSNRVYSCGVGSYEDLCFSVMGTRIPVELTSFTATVLGNYIELNWTTATELNNSGFQIERSKKQEARSNNWGSIGFVEGNGTTTEPNNYTFIDKNVKDGKYVYRLKQLDYDGTYEYSNEVEIVFLGVAKFSLEQNYPNPFNPSTSIQYAIGSRQFVQLKVYDVLGNEIATLVDEEKPAGNYIVEFNSSRHSRENGNLTSGIYFYQLKAGNYLETKKMIYLK